jgi:hypothetical protein
MNDHKKVGPFIDYHFEHINGGPKAQQSYSLSNRGRRPNNLIVYLIGAGGPTILWSIR